MATRAERARANRLARRVALLDSPRGRFYGARRMERSRLQIESIVIPMEPYYFQMEKSAFLEYASLLGISLNDVNPSVCGVGSQSSRLEGKRGANGK